jgi:hypothetical protein
MGKLTDAMLHGQAVLGLLALTLSMEAEYSFETKVANYKPM